MNKSQRIHLDVEATNTDKYIKVALEQNVDTLEFLSMNLDTQDVYQNFNADYGVLIGRVSANGGVGIPNAKISIFIPLDDTDAQDGEISSIYPYKTPRDKNNDGKRYNLLPRVGKINPSTGIVSPKQPFGSFPIKEELVTNSEYMTVYKKYYKYTALTNGAGDYMIFGVPIGTQTVHLSVDITDIGKYSMTPAAMVTNLGYSPNLFTDNNSKIKPSTDLGDLPNIETQEIAVDVIPFWGDTQNFTIGITRQDFRIRSVLINTFTIFGTAFTDGDNSMWAQDHSSSRYIAEMWRIRDPAETNETMIAKRIGKVTEKIYYYPPEITDAMLALNPLSPSYPDPITSMKVLDPTEYSVYKRDGDFVFIISCNRNKVVTDEFGNETAVPSNSPNGIYTRFRGFMTLEMTPADIPMNFTGKIGDNTNVIPFRYKFKFPQTSPAQASLTNPLSNGTELAQNDLWRKEHKIFSGGTIYSIARFHGTTANGYEGNDSNQFHDGSYPNFMHYTSVNYVGNPIDSFWNVGTIITGPIAGVTADEQFEFPSNAVAAGNFQVFGAQWMNFAVHFPQVGFISAGYSYIRDVRTTDNFHPNADGQAAFNEYFNKDNTQPIVAGDFNTKWFARTDLHWTDFIEVPKQDLLLIEQVIPKGFTSNTVAGLTGKYRNGTYVPSGAWTPQACPYNGGKTNGIPTNGVDTKTYFYKGLDKANCIEYLISLGLV